MNRENPFWMVFVDGGSAPTFKHQSYASADTEAKRLTRLTSRKSYVLCSIIAFEPPKEFLITDCRPENDGLPF